MGESHMKKIFVPKTEKKTVSIVCFALIVNIGIVACTTFIWLCFVQV